MERETVYLSKRMLIRAVKKGTKYLREEAIQTMGYTVIAKDGWVVRDYGDGRIERISEIPKCNRPDKFVFNKLNPLK